MDSSRTKKCQQQTSMIKECWWISIQKKYRSLHVFRVCVCFVCFVCAVWIESNWIELCRFEWNHSTHSTDEHSHTSSYGKRGWNTESLAIELYRYIKIWWLSSICAYSNRSNNRQTNQHTNNKKMSNHQRELISFDSTNTTKIDLY